MADHSNNSGDRSRSSVIATQPLIPAHQRWTNSPGLPSEVMTIIAKMRDEKIITEQDFAAIFQRGTLESLVEILQALPSFETRDRRPGRRRERLLSLSNTGAGFLDRMRKFENSFNTICQVDGFGCVAWGLFKFLVMNPANDIRDANNVVRKGLQEFIDIVDVAEFDVHTFSSNPGFSMELRNVLMVLYQHVFQFLLASMQFVLKKKLGSLASLRLFASAMVGRQNLKDVLEHLLSQLQQSGLRLKTVAEAFGRRVELEHFSLGQSHYQFAQAHAAMDIHHHSEAMLALSGIQTSLAFRQPIAVPTIPNPDIHRSLEWDHHIFDGAPSGTFFVGRDGDLDKLRQGLVGNDEVQGSHRAIISGLSGMGKSHLARRHADRHSGEYDLIVWVNCATEDSFQRDIDHLIDAIHLSHHIQGQSLSIRHLQLKRALRNTSSSWLFILDDCNEATAEMVLEFCPSGGGDIIFTTKCASTADFLGERAGLTGKDLPARLVLEDLSKEASAEILLQGVSPEQRPAQAKAVMQIVHQVRGLPSLLRHLRILSRDIQLSGDYEEVLLRMQYATRPLMSPGNGLGKNIGPDQIRRLLDGLSPPAKALVQLLSCFLGTPVPEFVLDMLPKVQDRRRRSAGMEGEDMEESEWDDPEQASLQSGFQALADVSVLRASICEIQRRYLISRITTKLKKKTARDLIALHPAVAHSSRTLEPLRVSPADSRKILRLAIDLSNAAFPQYDGHLKLGPEDWLQGEAMLLPAVALQNLAREVGTHHDLTGSLKVLYEIACRKFFWTGDKRGTLAIISAVLGDISQPLEEKTDGEFAFAYLLARVLTTCYSTIKDSSYKEWEFPFLFRVYEESQRRYSDDDMRSIDLQQCLGTALSCDAPQDIDKKKFAVFSRMEVARKLSNAFGESHPRVLEAHASMAHSKALLSVDDRGLQDLIWLEEQVQEESTNKELSNTATLWNMAYAFQKRGQFDKMHTYAKRNFEIRRGMESRTHRGQLWDFLLYAQSLVMLRRWEELGELVQNQPELVDRSEPFLRLMGQTELSQHTLSDLFNTFYESDNMRDYASSAEIESHLILSESSSDWSKYMSEPPDTRYRVAVFLDMKDWKSLEHVVKESIMYRYPSGGELRGILSRREDKEAIQSLLWEILFRAQNSHQEYNTWHHNLEEQSIHANRRLDEDFVNMWHHTWTQIEADSATADFTVDYATEAMDGFFETPAPLKSLVIRAAALGNSDIMDFILERNPNIHVENHEGRTAFYYAAWLHHFGILERLLRHTGEEKPKFYFGSSSLLHLLCVKTWPTYEDAQTDQLELVLELLKRGHRPDYRYSPKHPSPVEIAKENRMHQIVRVLEDYCSKYVRR